LFFQLISRRHERGSLLITSNRTVGKCGVVFGDAIAATAILDRLLHHSHVVTIRGESYRLKEKRRAGGGAAATPRLDGIRVGSSTRLRDQFRMSPRSQFLVSLDTWCCRSKLAEIHLRQCLEALARHGQT